MFDDARSALNARSTREETTMSLAMIGSRVLLITCLLAGAGLMFLGGKELDGPLVAFGAGIAAMGAAGNMGIALGALRGHLTGHRHNRREHEYICALFGAEFGRLRADVMELAAEQAKLASIMERAARDELAAHRQHGPRNGTHS